jgi:ElaB/YqjD/DUF883 family membrane-anchored ribosome-binding protein
MRHKTGNGPDVDLERFLKDIRTVVRDGEELIKATATGAKHKTIAGLHSTDRAIRTHPYETLGIVFGLGIIIGLIALAACSSKSDPS